MKDRTFILLLLAPLLIAGLFAGYRLATRSKAQPPRDGGEAMIRLAAERTAELRLGRPLDTSERAMVRVVRTDAGGWTASFDEPLHSRIPWRTTGPTTNP